MLTFEEAFSKKATIIFAERYRLTAVLIPKAEQYTLDITILVKVRSCYNGIRRYSALSKALFFDKVEKKLKKQLTEFVTS